MRNLELFDLLVFPVFLLIFFIIYLYVRKTINNIGFNLITMFVLTFTLFYFIVPFIQIYFPNLRDYSSFFTILLNEKMNNVIFFNFLISFISLVIIIFSYHFGYKNYTKKIKPNISFNNKIYRNISIVTDLLFTISVTSIMLLINEVGSFKTYLSLGALTRGIDKDPTQFIRSSYLQIVTLSVTILAVPFLYLFLYKIKKSKVILIKFIIAIIFSVIFLIYNQGRAPFLLFFLPFFLLSPRIRKAGLFNLMILFAIAIYLLKYLDSLFGYVAYGVIKFNESENAVTSFLSEFSYPFANFTLRNELISLSGYRYFYDYIIWPFTMIPSSITKLIGLSKETIVSVSLVNTSSYGYLVGIKSSGGIPVDFLTFNYYQLGYVGLIIALLISGKILRYLDNIFYYFKDNILIKIILLRISISMINIMNNADISAILRNRLDIVILTLILIYIYKVDLKSKLS